MRFDKIIISNYRQYESMVLEFPKTSATDLHVVIASNGIGKTNLLNSIDWCLYGEESHLGDKDESLSICNLNAIDRAKNSGLSHADVSVKILAQEKDSSIQFERTVAVNPNTLVPGIDKFQVTITPESGNTQILEGELATGLVDAYLPKKIKQYFFFDGEQLYNYFGKSQDITHVKDSIHEIAQINVVTHSREHLEATISEKQREIAKLNPATEKLQQDLESLKASKLIKENDIEALKAQVSEADDTIDELNAKIAGMESVAEDDRNYKRINGQIDDLEYHKEELERDFSSLIRKYYVLLMFYGVNKRTADFIEDKESKGYLPPEINKDLVAKSIETHECAICHQHLMEDRIAELENLLKKFAVTTSVSNKLMEIKNDVSHACRDALRYEKDREALFKAIRKTDEDIKELEDEAERLYKKISGCSCAEDIQDWMDQREELKTSRQVNNQKIGSYSKECEDLEKRIELKQAQIDQATSGEKRCAELREQLIFTNEACRVLKEIESEVISEVRNKMEKETFDIFSKLIWKTNTYGRIELSSDYRLRLFHVHGDSCLGSCSAAERELLALAFTLALHKVSHHDSLLFIDTPVGRVSDENRECFAKSLISVSHDKQLILAFTPSEYSSEISKYFDDCASSFNRLGTLNETATTRV